MEILEGSRSFLPAHRDGVVRGLVLSASISASALLAFPDASGATEVGATEQIVDLPRRLSVENSPDGFVPSAGDVAYDAPRGNLAIFYRDFRDSPGLIKLGRREGDIAALKQAGTMAVAIER